MDVVYLVRPGDDNDELRYSLRSLGNFPHGDVWIVGHTPAWVREVRSIRTRPLREKWANLRQSLTVLCEQGPDSFVLFNDDFYVTRPVDVLPVYHLGRAVDLIERRRREGADGWNSWFWGLRVTYDQMTRWGYPDCLAYEGHCPTPWARAELAGLLGRADPHVPFLWNTAYSATTGPEGERGVNVKITASDDLAVRLAEIGDVPFLSTDDDSFASRPVGVHVRSLFPARCRYEAAA